jgi:NAD-dependent histone deacetylase SIR2
LFRDREKVDLLIVIGTSLRVAPVSEVLGKYYFSPSYLSSKAHNTAHIPHSIPQIYINMEEVNHVELDVCFSRQPETRGHADGQICLIGDADKTIGYLAKRMGLKIPPPPPKVVSFQSTMKGTSTTNTKEDTENVNDEEAIWLSGMGDM